MLTRLAWGAARALPIVALAIGWELFARSGRVTPFMLPPLSDVLDAHPARRHHGRSLINTGLTLYRALAGFLISAVGGVVLGLAMVAQRFGAVVLRSDRLGRIPDAEDRVSADRHPMARLLRRLQDRDRGVRRDIPGDHGDDRRIQGVERELIWSARNMGARERDLMWQILLPAALPQILTGLQVALPLCLIVAVVAEMAMGGYGLGGVMMTSSRFADSRGVFAGIVEIAIVGYCLVKAMSILRHRLLRWHQEAMEPSTQ